MVLVLASACPGDDGSSEEGAGSTAGTSVGTSQGSDGTVGPTTSDDSASGTDGTDGTDGTGNTDTGPVVCEFEPTATIEATLEVTIELVNDTADPVYVVGSAEYCLPFSVAQGGQELALALGHLCGCECPPPPMPTVEVIALEPGQTQELTWDGRALALYQERYLCDTECWSSTNGAPQPQPPGPLTLTIPIYESLDPFEQEQLDNLENRCAAPLSFEVSFDLGSEDLTVSVLLSSVTIG